MYDHPEATAADLARLKPIVDVAVARFEEHQALKQELAALKKVEGLGPKTFEQAAGFLRIQGGHNPLDASAIHPESYAVAEAVLKRAGLSMQAEPAEREAALIRLQERMPLDRLAAELGTVSETFSRTLAKFREQKFIAVKGKTLTVLSPARLKAL